ncbi:MAG TPA: PHB depolymerase family esterase [Candidatus Competibacter sp.]|nr:PHB depolymerase family esterase [Candidatus Competibacter sp.]
MEREAASAATPMQVVVRGRVEMPGPEDIAIDHVVGIGFVASQQRRSTARELLGPEKMPGGAIFALDLNREPLVPRRLMDEATLGVPFHPRGCSPSCGAQGQRRLLVISDRAATDHVVEVFDVEGEAFAAMGLRHVQTVAGAGHLVSPNDLVALDGGQFYVTNDHGARQALLQLLETGTALPWSTVAFWDGHRFRTVAKGIAFANSIALDPACGRLYVAATRSKKIHAYVWDASNPAKELTDFVSIDLPGCPDNLEWDKEGHLWISTDPSFVRLALYAAGMSSTAPSLVLRLCFDGEKSPRIEKVWRDETGAIISASSVAATASAMAFSGTASGGGLFPHPKETCEPLAQVTDFGKNPGGLLMCAYVPPGLSNGRPLVVALHGCSQQAKDYGDGPGWTRLAGEYRFALLLPQQTKANNPMRCFNWFEPNDVKRHDATGKVDPSVKARGWAI